MSALATFSTFSPAYQNIANRMTRLKQHKSTQSLSQIRPNSARKVELNVFAIDPKENSPYQPRRRLSPTNVLLADEIATASNAKYTGNTGRVAKNTGLKKYNQTQFRDIANVKNTINLKTEGNNSSRGNFAPCVNQNLGLYHIKSGKDEIKMPESYKSFAKPSKNFIPGRIYSRQVLNTLFV